LTGGKARSFGDFFVSSLRQVVQASQRHLIFNLTCAANASATCFPTSVVVIVIAIIVIVIAPLVFIIVS